MESVQIEIFGQLYSIKGKDDAAYIRQLAAFIDGKMKEVQKGTGTVDPHRVAILAALTITDELHRLRQQHSALERMVEQNMKMLLDVSAPRGKQDKVR
jgi:cell division protein ZapA